MSDVPICPEWWPQLLWNLHFLPRPGGGPGPINYPPIVEDIMASLHIHTMSYMMRNQTAAGDIRKVVEQQLVQAVGNLDKAHQESAKKTQN
jgi:hypothetical protein